MVHEESYSSLPSLPIRAFVLPVDVLLVDASILSCFILMVSIIFSALDKNVCLTCRTLLMSWATAQWLGNLT